MGFREDLMLKKVESIVEQEFGKGDYKKEDKEKIIEKTKEAINNRQIRRFEDLRNFVHASFEEVSKKEPGPIA